VPAGEQREATVSICVLAAKMTEKIRSAWPQIRATISDERFSPAFEHNVDRVPIMNGSPSTRRGRSAAGRFDRT
jgi:hypothetical protein